MVSAGQAVLAMALYWIAASLAGNCAALAADGARSVAVIPRPAKMTLGSGTFAVRPDTRLLVDIVAISTGRHLADSLKAIGGWSLSMERNEAGASHNNAIVLKLDPSLARLGEEGYVLAVEPQTVMVRAAQPAGLFYGCQTLRQLLLAPDVKETVRRRGTLPCLEIEDRPRFAWRGLMLDPARQFLTKDFLKRYIDMMAFYKLNRLQLHLTDDVAWTIEIKKYPELTDTMRWPVLPADRARGVYTHEDVRELVSYAAERNVMLVPEIEMPAHNAIPGWVLADKVLCSNNPYRAHEKPFEEKKTYEWTEPCAANPKTREIYQDILREVMEIFPSPYIHLGGDEYYGLAWARCPECRKLIETEHLRRFETEELKGLFAKCLGSKEKYLVYRWLMTRMCDFVRSQGRRPVLWDDLSWRGQFPLGAVIMQWHYQGGVDYMQLTTTPESPAVEAAHADRDVVIAPFNCLYFDLNSSLEAVYRFDPMPAGLTREQRAHILGPHAPVWEQRQDRVEGRTFPRVYALAEIGWTPADLRDLQDFARRLAVHEEHRVVIGGE